MIRTKRVYEPPSPDDGERVLVERLWPRGLTKEAAWVDLWLKELSPSPELRRWYAHDLNRWQEFRRRYEAELETPDDQDLLQQLAEKARARNVTLVYAARDTEHNSAVVLREIVEQYIRRSG